MPVKRSRSMRGGGRGCGWSKDKRKHFIHCDKAYKKKGIRKSVRRGKSQRGGAKGCGWSKDKRRSMKRRYGSGHHNHHKKSHGHGRRRVLLCDGAGCKNGRRLSK